MRSARPLLIRGRQWMRTVFPLLAICICLAPSSRSVAEEKKDRALQMRATSGLDSEAFLPLLDPGDMEVRRINLPTEARTAAQMRRMDHGKGLASKDSDLLLEMADMKHEVRIYATAANPQQFKDFFARFCKNYFSPAWNEYSEPYITGDIRKAARQLAAACALRGFDREAEEFHNREIQQRRTTGTPAQLARALDGYGMMLAAQGHADRAGEIFRETLEVRKRENIADEVRSWMLLAGLRLANEPTAGDPFAEAEARLDSGRRNFISLPDQGIPDSESLARRLNALTPVEELAWHFLTRGKYDIADRLMSAVVAARKKWQVPASIFQPRLNRVIPLATGRERICAIAAGRRVDALHVALAESDRDFGVVRANGWRSGYDQTLPFELPTQGLEGAADDPIAAGALIDRVIERTGFNFHLALEKRRLLSSPDAPESARTTWRKIVEQRQKQRDFILSDRSLGTSLYNEIEKLEAGLATALGEPPVPHGSFAKRLATALAPDAAFVNYILSTRWIEKNKVEDEWAAVVLQPGRPAAYVRCGSVEAVRTQLARYRHLAVSAGSEEELDQTSRALYGSLVAPIEKVLAPDTGIVFLCPDSALAFVGFGALLDEQGRFWCERRDVRYLTGGRALISPSAGPAANRTVKLLGNPRFDAPAQKELIDPLEAYRAHRKQLGFDKILADDLESRKDLSPEMRAKIKRDSAAHEATEEKLQAQLLKKAKVTSVDLVLAPLPGTGKEVAALKTWFEQHDWSVTSLVGDAATEPRFREGSAPRILHLATHGFFLERLPERKIVEFQGRDEAMPPDQLAGRGHTLHVFGLHPFLRSCLALAGAQTTVGQWKKGELPRTAADGILMADEVVHMDLSPTQLVTLSACETGLGGSVSGEGAVGIQRAFLLAGAKHVLATLWPIADEETVEFMTAFYQRVLAGEPPPAALSAVQRELLVERRKKLGLAQAVFFTAPFILTSASQ